MFAQNLSYSHSGQKFVHHEVHEETRNHCFLLDFFVAFVIFVVKSLFGSGLSGLGICQKCVHVLIGFSIFNSQYSIVNYLRPGLFGQTDFQITLEASLSLIYCLVIIETEIDFRKSVVSLSNG